LRRTSVNIVSQPRVAGIGITTAALCPHLELPMTLGTILLIVLVLLLVGAIPSWPYSRGWGYGPSGLLGVVLVVLLILLLTGRI
jgi:hypothetical protein